MGFIHDEILLELPRTASFEHELEIIEAILCDSMKQVDSLEQRTDNFRLPDWALRSYPIFLSPAKVQYLPVGLKKPNSSEIAGGKSLFGSRSESGRFSVGKLYFVDR